MILHFLPGPPKKNLIWSVQLWNRNIRKQIWIHLVFITLSNTYTILKLCHTNLNCNCNSWYIRATVARVPFRSYLYWTGQYKICTDKCVQYNFKCTSIRCGVITFTPYFIKIKASGTSRLFIQTSFRSWRILAHECNRLRLVLYIYINFISIFIF